MLDKSIKSRDKLTLTNANFHSLDLNHSITNSVLTSSYIVLKDGTKKKKRHVNSYMEEFLEKRRMAAEFAQSKRSTSTKNYRVKLIKNEENVKDEEFNVNINIKKMEEIININNLKNNLPGKTKELIDNTNNNIIQNKYNNYKRHNIIYTKKINLSQNNNYKNTNFSNHSFTEDRYNTNHENDEQCNIININNIKNISPIKTNQISLNAKGSIYEKEKVLKDNKNEEEKSEVENKESNNNEHFLSIMEKMINNNINKNQTSPNSLERDSFKFNNKYKEYEKFLNINDNKNEEIKEDNNDTNKETFIIANNLKKENLNLDMDNINNNSTIKSNQEKNDDSLKKIKLKNEEYIVEENDEKNIEGKKENEIENEEIEQEKSIERKNEEEEIEEEDNNKIYNENEEEENEDIERCEVLKGDVDKTKYLKGKKNIITEEIEEVEEGMEINENTSEFPTIKSGRNKNSKRGLLTLNLEKNSNSKENSMKKLENKDNNGEKKEESFKIIKEEKKYNNVTKIEIKDLKKNKDNNINNNSSKNYNFIYSNTSINNKRNIEKNTNMENIEESNKNNIINITKSNNKKKEGDFNNNEMINIKKNLLINNDDFDFNKLSDINNINSEIKESPNDTNFINYEKINKEKEDFMRIINKDIERLEKIRNNNNMMNNGSKENESYIYEIDNFINLMREKRRSVNNDIKINDISYKNNQDYIPPKNILELKKIYKNLNNKNNIYINIDTNYNNNIIQRKNYNKMKLPISKSTSLQSLLNEIKKEKTYNININNININNENKIINNNFFTEKINKEINDSFDKKEESKLNDDNKNDFKLFDETKFKKIKEANLRKRNKIRNEFKFKDYENNKNLSHIYLDKVKEDILMNISATKISNKNEIKNKMNIKKINFLNNPDIEMNDSEIMPANNMKSLYINNNNKF